MLVQILEPTDGVSSNLTDILFQFGNILFELKHHGLVLGQIEAEDPCHAYFQQLLQIVVGNGANKTMGIRFQPRLYMHESILFALGLFELTIFIDTLFYENPLERSCQILFPLLFQTDRQFLLQQLPCSLRTITQQISHSQEYRLVVHDDASIRRLTYFTVCKGIECIDGFVRRYTRSQMNTYIGFGSRHIIYSFDLDLALFIGFQNGFDQGRRRLATGQFGNAESTIVQFANLSPALDLSSAPAVIVPAGIHHTTGREIGIKIERLSSQMCDTCHEQFTEIVRQDLGVQTYSNSFRALCQEKWKLYGQSHRLVLAAIVRTFPVRNLIIEKSLLSQS